MERTLSHDLVDLAIFLAADKLLVLICQLNLDPNGVLRLSHKADLRDDMQGGLDSIIRTIDGEGQPLERNLGIGVGTNVTKHSSNILVFGQPSAIRLSRPESAVELPSLCRR